jgi:uncharacterized protein (DUF2147 family)
MIKTTILISVFILAFVALACGGVQAYAAVSVAPGSEPILGYWYTEGHEGGVELYQCDEKICGKFRWLKPTSKPGDALDDNNPDPEKRSRQLCQLEFMTDFKPDGQGHYTGGVIYSPRHGQNFNANMTLIDHDTLKVHGYILTPMLGESQTWTRAKTMSVCTVN